MGLKRPLSFGIRTMGLVVAVTGTLMMMISYRSVQATSNTPQVVSDFSLPDVNGKTVKLSTLGAKAYVLDVWATWCPPCRQEIPNFVELQHKYQSKGLRVVGIALDDEGAAVVKPFVEKNNIDYTILIGNPSIEKILGNIDNIPTTFFLDSQLRVHKVEVGYHTTAQLDQEIQAVLGGSAP